MTSPSPGSGATSCGPRERALFFEALAHAVDGEEVDARESQHVLAMEDAVLAFLVRALVSGRLAPDGVLFLAPSELALAERSMQMPKEDEGDGSPAPVEEAAYDGDGGSPATMTSSEPHQ